MQVSVALLFESLLHTACQGDDKEQIDPRNLRTFCQMLSALLAMRSTRLLTLAQAILPQRRATSVKALAMGLGYFLEKAQFPMRPFATALLDAALRRLAPERLAWYRGKVLLVVDPADYAKRSRGRGKRGRQMRFIGRVREPKAKAAGKRKGKRAKVSALSTAKGEASRGAAMVATTLPVDTVADAKGVAWLYAQRCAVESASETMYAWGQDRFILRPWEAIDRLLCMMALAYALLVLALQDGKLVAFRKQAVAVLKRVSVLGCCPTVGKLTEAIGLDFGKHEAAWASVWLG